MSGSRETTRVCVLGLGYIGLPTAAVLASRGFEVHGVEIDGRAVEVINSGQAHIVEPELDMLVQAGVQTGRLRAHAAPAEADVFMLCVPTPLGAGDRPDLGYVDAACESILPYMRPGNLVILESTSPPGTTERLAARIRGVAGEGVRVAHAPERVLPGRILREVVENDRVIGGVDEASTEAARRLYEKFVTGSLIATTARTAETVKLCENAYRDVNIAFANELSAVSERLGLDVWEVIRLANHHPRVNILSPGPGVGGHCIPIDPYFLIDATPEEARLMARAREVNRAQPGRVFERVRRAASRFRTPRIACLGLAYKPDIDDMRESPAVQIARRVRDELGAELGAVVSVVEPNLSSGRAGERAGEGAGGGEAAGFELSPLEDAVGSADIVVVLVAHSAFRTLSLRGLSDKVVIDACGALGPGGGERGGA